MEGITYSEAKLTQTVASAATCAVSSNDGEMYQQLIVRGKCHCYTRHVLNLTAQLDFNKKRFPSRMG
ncbi:unnamed protein product [Cylicocyclus nassatus]|uniref:Uncharacterized protein n=1 Tax=Cylicocyclus nassatus TaxID=53992 RepID=A0AA36GXA1_CYLNA|nr:unnamed protein product [Cylicocyclus nassatus]